MEYSLRVLNERLDRERTSLAGWRRSAENGDPLERRQAEGNIPSNEHRIGDLEGAIVLVSEVAERQRAEKRAARETPKKEQR